MWLFSSPNGVNGWHEIDTQRISPIECTTGIRDQCRFRYQGVFYDFVNYKDVNSRFKSWSILGKDALESKYWRWVLCLFEDEFVKHYDVQKHPYIKNNWRRFTEDEVIRDLESQYQIRHFRKT